MLMLYLGRVMFYCLLYCLLYSSEKSVDNDSAYSLCRSLKSQTLWHRAVRTFAVSSHSAWAA